ncbi:MAG: hypothetical protein V7677_10775 [Motiliproteus sp.]
MTLISLFKTAFDRSRAVHAEGALYHKLSGLDAYLLEDMGLKLEGGRVLSTRQAPLVSSLENAAEETAALSEKHYQSELKGAGG